MQSEHFQRFLFLFATQGWSNPGLPFANAFGIAERSSNCTIAGKPKRLSLNPMTVLTLSPGLKTSSKHYEFSPAVSRERTGVSNAHSHVY